MKTIPVEVLSNKKEAQGIYRIVLETLVPMNELDPGSFFMVRVTDGIDPLLRRPLGVYRVGPGGIEMLYQVRGRGTELLSRLKPGNQTDLVGPLGTGWMRMDGADQILLVAGGMGMAPLHDLAMNMRDFGDMRPIHMIWGHKDKSTICCIPHLRDLDLNIVITTEDGSQGLKGMVTDHLADTFNKMNSKRVQVAACGPFPMLKQVSAFAMDNRLPCQVSLEAYMGCGIGACLTCVVPGTDGNNLRVCKEGPVFWAQRINWEEIK